MAVLGIRHKNPGCIRGEGPKGFAVYDTFEDGYIALADLLYRKYNGKTALQIFNIYAPASDGNNPQKYARQVIQSLKEQGIDISSTTKLDLQNPKILAAMVVAIAQIECGQVPEGPDFAKQCVYKFINQTALEKLHELNPAFFNYVRPSSPSLIKKQHPSSRLQIPQTTADVQRTITQLTQKPKISLLVPKKITPFEQACLNAQTAVINYIITHKITENATEEEKQDFIQERCKQSMALADKHLSSQKKKNHQDSEAAIIQIAETATLHAAQTAYKRALTTEETEQIKQDVQKYAQQRKSSKKKSTSANKSTVKQTLKKAEKEGKETTIKENRTLAKTQEKVPEKSSDTTEQDKKSTTKDNTR